MKKLLIIFIFSFSILADEVVWLGRSARGLLMGDAWTALANNDEMTLFYNPASLGANESVSFSPLPFKFGVTNIIDDMDKFSNFPSDAAGISKKILGTPIYLELSSFPGLKMFHFAFNLYATNKTSMILRNLVHPNLEIDYRYDRGFSTGFAYNLIGGRTNKGAKLANGNRLSIGYGLKYIRREALKNKFDLFGTGLLDTLASGVSTPAEIREALGGVDGKAWGHDLGLEYSTGNGTSELIAGLSVLNAGTTRFKKLSGDGAVPEQSMYVNSGIAFKQDLTFVDYAISMDVKPINAPIPWGRMVSIGAMVNIPFLSIYGGWGQGYFNYGAEFRFFPFTIIAGFYNTELASEYREEQGKRAFIYLSLFDGSFDIF